MGNYKRRIFFVCNVDWFFLSHRLPIALEMKKRGYDVFLLTHDTGKCFLIENYGIKTLPIPFQRSGTNPIHELRCIYLLCKYYKQFNPDIIHHITLKVALLGSFAAKIQGRKNVINAISGLGYNFTAGRKGILQLFIWKLLKVVFKSKHFRFILQNPDDTQLIGQLNLVPNNHIYLIKGSGVDLSEYAYCKKEESNVVEVLFPARILKDKGVRELLEAAHILKKQLYGKVKFVLAGNCDSGNLAVFPESQLNPLLIDNYIEWIGFKKDMYEVYKSSDIVILPSYREGLPKSLIEACAVGRPIITTNVPGCRECVIEGYNGLLISAYSAKAIVDALLKLCFDFDLRLKMGENSRKFAEMNFSIEYVVEQHIAIYNELLYSKHSN